MLFHKTRIFLSKKLNNWTILDRYLIEKIIALIISIPVATSNKWDIPKTQAKLWTIIWDL